MPAKQVVINHSLNAGEVSPRFDARQDQNKHNAACETLQNIRPLVVGGGIVREGTQFVTEAKIVADHTVKRLLSFVAARDAAYVIEVGHQYARFFKDGAFVMDGLNPLELVLPYDDTDLAELFTVQSIDVMYLLHRNYAPRKLSRIAVDEFTITQVNFDPPALVEEEPTGTDLNGGTLTPAATTGSAITFTASGTPFLASDVGRIIVHGGSRAVIVTVTDSSHVDADIIDDFPDTNPIPADEWRLRLSPQTTLDIDNDKVEVNEIITLTAGANAFRAADAGKYVTIFGGLVRIDLINSPTSARGTIKIRLADVDVSNPDATRAWTLEIPAWSATLGWPSCGCFFEERLWLCKGLTVNGSVTNDFENFGKGGSADDAIARTISDDDVDAIVWIKAHNSLKVGTGSGIYECSPTTQNGALTPTSFRASPISPNGGARLQPLRVTPVLIYVDVSQRELRELSYSFAEDNFKSPQLFRLAEHLMEGFRIVELTASANPDNVVYVVRNDGTLLGLVYEQTEQVIGWFRIVTDGEIKSVCVIPRPSSGKDWLWQIVERTNGIFIEYYEPDHADTGREWRSLHTDSAVVAAPVAGVVSGLDHLEGETVKIVGDGMLFVDQRVVGGQVTLNPALTPSLVEVGLPYEAVCVPVEPAIPAELGGPFIARGFSKIGVRVRRALGLTLRAYRVGMTEPGDDTIVGETLVYRKAYHPMDAHVPLQRGKKCVLNLGFDPFSRIEVKQSLPFPAEILNVVGYLNIGDEWDCETYDEPTAVVVVDDDDVPPPPALCPEDTEPGLQTLTEVAALPTPIGAPAERAAILTVEIAGGQELIYQRFSGGDVGRIYKHVGVNNMTAIGAEDALGGGAWAHTHGGTGNRHGFRGFSNNGISTTIRMNLVDSAGNITFRSGILGDTNGPIMFTAEDGLIWMAAGYPNIGGGGPTSLKKWNYTDSPAVEIASVGHSGSVWVSAMHKTPGGHLYMMELDGAAAKHWIIKYHPDTLAEVARFDIGGVGSFHETIFAVSDDLIYFTRQIASNEPLQIWYWAGGEGGHVGMVDDNVQGWSGWVCFGTYQIFPSFKQMHVARIGSEQWIYLTSSGWNGNNTAIHKIGPIVCP